MNTLREQLWPIFIEEVGDQIDALEAILETASSQQGAVDVHALFRHFHTIKSNGSMMDFQSVEKLAHASEDMLFIFRENALVINAETATLLVRAVDALKQQLDHITRFRENPLLDEGLLTDLLRHAENSGKPLQEEAVTALSNVASEEQAAAELDDETMRVSSATLDDLVSSVGNMAMRENMFSHVIHDGEVLNLVQRVRGSLPRFQADVLTGTGRRLVKDLLSALDDTHTRALQADQSIQAALTRIEQDVLDLRVVPIAAVFNRLPLLVKKTAEQAGKQVELVMQGAEVRIDKRMVDTLMEPLVHIIRNAVDHGIEVADVRKKNGKDEVGLITVKAEQDSGMLVLDIADDGKGLDTERIVARARANGLVANDHVFTSVEQIHQLIFLPGFSTAEAVTETSGRGVGMDVVKTKITALGGQVELLSSPGKGSRFRLHLPLSVAIQSVLLLRWQEQTYALALRAVSEILPCSRETLSTVCGQSTLLFRDEVLPVTSLGHLLDLPETFSDTAREVIVIRRQDEWLGILVDQVIGQQELIVREVHTDLSSLPGLGGVSLLGDGRVVIILDSDHLLDVSSRQAYRMAGAVA